MKKECPACDCKYDTEAELMRHLYNGHKEIMRDLTEKTYQSMDSPF